MVCSSLWGNIFYISKESGPSEPGSPLPHSQPAVRCSHTHGPHSPVTLCHWTDICFCASPTQMLVTHTHTRARYVWIDSRTQTKQRQESVDHRDFNLHHRGTHDRCLRTCLASMHYTFYTCVKPLHQCINNFDVPTISVSHRFARKTHNTTVLYVFMTKAVLKHLTSNKRNPFSRQWYSYPYTFVSVFFPRTHLNDRL